MAGRISGEPLRAGWLSCDTNLLNTLFISQMSAFINDCGSNGARIKAPNSE